MTPVHRHTRKFLDDFDGADLDPGVWVPHYLPMWSARVGERRDMPELAVDWVRA